MLFKKLRIKTYKYRRISSSDLTPHTSKCEFYGCNCYKAEGGIVENPICMVCNRDICKGLYLTKYHHSYIHVSS